MKARLKKKQNKKLLTEEFLKRNFECRYYDRYYVGNSFYIRGYEVGIMIDAYESPQFWSLFEIRYVNQLRAFLKLCGIKKNLK